MGLALLGQLIRREHDSREVGTEVGTTQGENVSSEYLQISLRNIRKGRDFGQHDRGCGDGVGRKRGGSDSGLYNLELRSKHIRIHFNSLARRRGRTTSEPTVDSLDSSPVTNDYRYHQPGRLLEMVIQGPLELLV